MTRPRKQVSVEELLTLTDAACAELGVSSVFLAPTSEYLTDFVLERTSTFLGQRLATYPMVQIPYSRLSSKSFPYEPRVWKKEFVVPRKLYGSRNDIPFVAKPTLNVIDSRALKPFLVNDEESFRKFNGTRDKYFAQAWMPGPSRYLCGFLDSLGNVTTYVQRNLLQQPEGGRLA
jgi:hypothetical protein